MRLPAPVIAQVSEAPRGVTPLLDVQVGQDGLLRRRGAESPLVEELLFHSESAAAHMHTVVTESFDNPDPAARTGGRIHSSERSFWLGTVMTKGFDEPDPNRPRLGRR